MIQLIACAAVIFNSPLYVNAVTTFAATMSINQPMYLNNNVSYPSAFHGPIIVSPPLQVCSAHMSLVLAVTSTVHRRWWWLVSELRKPDFHSHRGIQHSMPSARHEGRPVWHRGMSQLVSCTQRCTYSGVNFV